MHLVIPDYDIVLRFFYLTLSNFIPYNVRILLGISPSLRKTRGSIWVFETVSQLAL